MEFMGGEKSLVMEAEDGCLDVWKNGQEKTKRGMSVQLIERRRANALDPQGVQVLIDNGLVPRRAAQRDPMVVSPRGARGTIECYE